MGVNLFMTYPDFQEATTYLHEHIPLSEAMAVSIRYLGADKAILAAPLAPNINHRQTAFGGSISSIAVLSAWAYLHFRLQTMFDQSYRVVISRSETTYIKPVAGDFQAICLAPEEVDWNKFSAGLTRHHKGRIVLSAYIYGENDHQNPLALFTGTFVAVSPGSDESV